ncbi:hypothetical protein Tco_0321862 [Tanacetum coccineum]
MSTQQDINAFRAQRLANTHDPLTLMANTQTPFHPDQSSHITYIQHPQPNNNFVPQPSFNTNYLQYPMQNPRDISNLTTALDMALEFMSKAFQLNNTTPTNNNQRSSSNPCYSQIAQPGMNMDQDRQMLMVDDNVGNQFRPNAMQNVRNQVVLNASQNSGVQNVGNQTRLGVVSEIANQYGNGNVVTAPAEGNGACEETERANANCTLENNLQQASSSEVQYTELLEPIPKPHQVQQNDSNVISAVSSVEQSGGTVEQHPANVEETRVLYDSLYNNLAIKVEKVNSVNRKLKETNADLTTELARYKNQETCFEINQEKYDKLERCYQKSVYQEECLTKKINALHLSSAKQITTLNEEIENLNNQLSKEKSTVSFLQEERKKLKNDFKTREEELLDKQIQLENKIKELDNILVKTVLLEKHDPPVVYDSEETLQLAQESREKMKQLNKEIKPANYTKINHLSGVFVSETAKSREELYFSNTSKTANVSISISIPNEEFLDDTTPSVARKFLNEVKSTIVTLQRVGKQKMTLDIHNWPSSVHQEIHKIVKDEIFSIINQIDARMQNFEIQFLKEAAKFVRDFKSLANEADESIAKQKALELDIERLLREVVSQDIMSIMQNPTVVETSDLQTELERTKERFENCIIKKENEYAKLWNDWYKKCEECKYDKILYDKAYNDMQQKIERLQAQLGDLRGKSKDTSCVSDTLDPLPQKLENENVSEQKDITKGTSANTKFANQTNLGKPSLQPLRNHSVVRQPNAFQSERPKRVPPKVVESNDLSKPVTSNSAPSSRESKVVKNDNVISSGSSRINPSKASRVDNFVPNKHVKASVRTKPITVSQPHVITKNDVNSKTNGFSLKDVKSTTKTKRP